MSIAFLPILGKPLIVWAGILTFIALILTVTTGHPKIQFKLKMDVKVHKYLAITTLLLAIFHAYLGLTAF